MRVAVIGGGLTGLTAAYELGKAGHAVELFEAGAELGGQLRTFALGDTRLEAFSHPLCPDDHDILDLAEELGLGDWVAWGPPRTGLLGLGRIYPLDTWRDLMRFSPLPIWNRLRLILTRLFLLRYRNWRELEGYTAQEWLRRWAGRPAYELVWQPLLQSEFGDARQEVSLALFWGRFRQRVGGRRLGYPRGSFQALIDALARAISAQGGHIYIGARVRLLQQEGGRVRHLYVRQDWRPGPFDVVVAAVPSPVIRQLAPFFSREYGNLLRAVRYQAKLCLVLQLKRPLSSVYRLIVGDPQGPFAEAVEHTNLVAPESYGGHHLLYLSSYLAPDHDRLVLSPEELLRACLPGLQRINPAFGPDWVEEYWRFADASAQPLGPPDYYMHVPPHRTSMPNLFLANSAQVYPEDCGANWSVRLGRKVARLVGEPAYRSSR